MRTFLLIVALAVADEGGEAPANVGEGKAIVAADAKTGLKLSEAAAKTLGLKTMEAARRVPASALVYFHDEVGVYRLRGGWYKLVEVEIVSKGREVVIETDELKPGDRIVVAGAALLRVAELDAFGGEEAGHGH